MNTIKIFTALALIVTAGLVSAFTFLKAGNNKPIVVTSDKGFAVVELFTSEGCSSCPPADEVIAKIEKEVSDKPVYILAYHVDYWNRLGWKDPFSSAAFSNRQNTYANWLNLSSAYTPQVIVNGKTEFVGSQEGTLRNTITANLRKSPKADLSLKGVNLTGNKALIKYATEGGADNTLLLALVQKAATIVVKRGENGGRTLSHVQIVSNLQNIPLVAKTGEASINLPDSFSAKNYEVIAFIQNTKTGEINAATKAAFTGTAVASN
ncbi:DUF1223 domain-containing protein [Mucilaginibacter glaciei]|uniref:DUF1223 domain-containing protein n=1 Tax=Mucilaginibacter glaciei TaxID=2772109 RepID=A0A926NYW0_9SPHI|nr:DUF1223 domain-containing protein [Mucilaginibacter glaciei]MBD1394204.1 DUF1223 domain-containing protein [Mucilaginibacter glaciei]